MSSIYYSKPALKLSPYFQVLALIKSFRKKGTSYSNHWNGVKDVLRYLRGTPDLSLFYPKNHLSLIGYADVGYLSDPIMVNPRQDSHFYTEGRLFH
jgi:hypothetical protein